MKYLLSALFLFLLLPVLVQGQQNHVPNGSFEDTIACPTSKEQLTTHCMHWSNYNSATSTDYHNSCATNITVSVPQNQFGSQNPFHGNAYAGIITYGINGTWHKGWRETFTAEIIPLQIGKNYLVSMYVNLAGGSTHASDNLGMYFFDSGPSVVDTAIAYKIVPQVSYKSYGIITDTTNWVKLVSAIAADSSYDNIVIGAFNDIDTLRVRAGGANWAYYYIDSVTVNEATSSLVFVDERRVCVGDSITIRYFSTIKHDTSNKYIIQLSTSTGSFSNAINIDTVSADSNTVIRCSIPENTSAGNGYRVRIVATSPADTSSDNKYNIKIDSPIPSKPVAIANSPLCAGDSLKFSATTSFSGATWLWEGPDSFYSSANNPVIHPVEHKHAGIYIVRAYNNTCISEPDTVIIVVDSALQPITASSNTFFCEPDTLKLSASNTIPSGAAYSWAGPAGYLSNMQNPIRTNTVYTMSGNYIVSASRLSCVVKDTIVVTIYPIPYFTATSNNPICLESVLQFNATSIFSGVAFTWTGPSGFNSTSPTPFVNNSTMGQGGNYIVTASLNGCMISDTLSVTVKPLPAKPVAGNNSPLCAGDSLHLNSSSSTSGVSYSWAGPNSFSSSVQDTSIANSTTAMSGNYVVTADLNGCSRKDTTTVLVKPMPAAVTVTNNGPLCAGGTLQLSSTGSTTGSAYNWTGPGSFSASTQNTNRVNTTAGMTGWYKMLVGLNGCTYADSTYATIHPIPAMPNINYSNPLCIGETLNLGTATVSGASYSWTGPGSFSSASQNPARGNIQFGDTGSYKLAVTVNGCTSDTAAATVHINPLPFVVIFANPADSICVGDRVNFTALPNNQGGTPAYQWYVNGQATGTGTIFSTTALNHQDVVRVDMTESTKCSIPYTDPSNDITMNVLPWLAPTVSITVNPNRPLKENEYATFTATATNAGNNPQYQWKRNGQDIVGATGSVWSANTLNDNDIITVTIVSDYKCPQPANATSNSITVKVLTGVTGIDDISGLVLHPNPNNGKFVLEGETPLRLSPKGREVLNLEVINAMGQVVHRQEIYIDNVKLYQEINMQQVPVGLYMLRLSGGGAIYTSRFSVR
jgi:hypothetical protein